MMKGERLRELRIKKGLTQQELGDLLGITKASICCYEKGTRTPSVETLLDIVMFFGVSSDYLIGNDVFITEENSDKISYVMSKEEVIFINELRKNKYLSDILLEDPKRGIELISKKIC